MNTFLNSRPLKVALATTAVAAVVLPVVAFAQGTPTVPGQPMPGRMGKMRRPRNENHPLINRAERQIAGALGTLRSAAKDFGGHKEKAMDLLQQAQRELQAAKQFDKN